MAFVLGYKSKGHYDRKVKWDKEWGRRIGGTTVKLGIPLKWLFNRFAERGFFQNARKGKATKLVTEDKINDSLRVMLALSKSYNADVRAHHVSIHSGKYEGPSST
jgi:hypothetical protein